MQQQQQQLRAQERINVNEYSKESVRSLRLSPSRRAYIVSSSQRDKAPPDKGISCQK